MEGARSDKQDVVGADHAVARADGCAFDDGKNVSLYTFAGDIGAVAAFTSGDFVDFVQEHNAGILHAVDGRARNLLHVDEALFLFLNEIFKGFANLDLALFGALAEEVGQHFLDVNVHLLDALIGDDFKGGERFFADINLDHFFVELAFAELVGKVFAGAGLRVLGELRRPLTATGVGRA